jgi:trimethylamine--corrinoid protein Co-methyltransferase
VKIIFSSTIECRNTLDSQPIQKKKEPPVTGSSAPNIIDPDTGKKRRATSSDIANIVFLIDELSGYDVFSISNLAADAPEGQFSLSRFYPA